MKKLDYRVYEVCLPRGVFLSALWGFNRSQAETIVEVFSAASGAKFYARPAPRKDKSHETERHHHPKLPQPRK